MIFVAMYLAAIVAANITVAIFGPSVTILNAFLWIGLDLTSRDRLHDQWGGNGLAWKMTLLILAGSLISFILNRDAGKIALASMVAFGIAAAIDTVFFHFLREKSETVRVNGSNIPSALADSIIFPSLAFNTFLPLIIVGQFAAKVLGGFFWYKILSIRWRI